MDGMKTLTQREGIAVESIVYVQFLNGTQNQINHEKKGSTGSQKDDSNQKENKEFGQSLVKEQGNHNFMIRLHGIMRLTTEVRPAGEVLRANTEKLGLIAREKKGITY